MNELVENLRFYETFKFEYSFKKVKEILNSNCIKSELVKTANSKISDNYIKDTEKFIVYIFVFKENNLHKLLKSEYNTFYTKIFGQPKLKNLQKYINDISKHKSLKQNEYKVSFYIFSKEKNKEQKKFNKLFQLIYNKYKEIDNQYEQEYLSNPINTIISFFIDSYDFFAKKMFFLFSILMLYALYYNKYELTLLGVPNEIISDMHIISILRLYASIILPVLFYFGVFIVIIMYMQSISSIKSYLYKSFKFFTSLLIYIILFTFIYYFDFFKINKNSIKEDDSFLNQCFYENYYPRFATADNNNSLMLILGEKNKKYYYYNVENLNIQNEKICKTIDSNNFTEIIINILKNSKNIGTKKINSSKKINFQFLNDNKSIQYIKKLYCKKIQQTLGANKKPH